MLFAHDRKVLSVAIVGMTAALMGALVSVSAYCKEKTAITQDAYDTWKRIESPVLSRDGKWVVYTLESPSGQAELIARSTRNHMEWRVPRSVATAQPQSSWSARYGSGRFGGDSARITADSKYVIFTIQPRASALNTASQATLGVLRLSDGRLVKLPGVSVYKVPEQSGQYLAYMRGGHNLSKLAEEQARQATTELEEIEQLNAKHGTLVVLNLETDSSIEIADVTSFAFNRDGNYLGYAYFSSNNTGGVFVRHMADGKLNLVSSGAESYSSLAFDGTGMRLAFLASDCDEKQKEVTYSVNYAEFPFLTAESVVNSDTLSGKVVDMESGVRFNPDGNALLFRVADPISRVRRSIGANDLIPVVKYSGAPGGGPRELSRRAEAKFELWHWKYFRPLPQGRVTRSKNDPFLAIYHILDHRYVQLESEQITNVSLTDDARYAIAFDATPYIPPWSSNRMTGGIRYKNLYFIDTATGASKLFRKGLSQTIVSDGSIGTAFFSPGGRYLTYFDQGRWFIYEIKSGRTVDITKPLLSTGEFVAGGANIDWPTIAGWTSQDKSMLVYDEHDIWQFDPTGSVQPINITNGVGRKSNLVFRRLIDYNGAINHLSYGVRKENLQNEFVLEDGSEILLSALNMDTMASGVWSARVGEARRPKELLMLDKRVRPVAVAEDSIQYLFTIESFEEFPDLWSGTDLGNLRRVSDANPQQHDYLWGSSELINFTNKLGAPLKGKLYKPENFDSSKKYPMIVSMYSMESTSFHEYGVPAPLSAPDSGHWPATSFISNGYLVFTPDIVKTPPSPGNGIMASLLPSIQDLVERGYVDENRIGISGHSYGGYNVAYAITRTDVFRCAVEGAGFSDFISAYAGSLNHAPGHFEKQLGGTIWENIDGYISNSPIFYANKVMTPLLIMHNDGERVVPFFQGVELFTALRRNGQEVYMFNYHGEDHSLARRVNKFDWDRRVHEYFDYCLKDGQRPAWMSGGAGSNTQPIH